MIYRWYTIGTNDLDVKLIIPRYFQMPQKWSLKFYCLGEGGEPRVVAKAKIIRWRWWIFKIYRTVIFDSKKTPSKYPNEMMREISNIHLKKG